MSFIEPQQSRTTTTLQTVAAITNATIGGICLTLPTNFIKSGAILSVIALVVFGAVNYLSAYIIVYYQREGEDNLMKLLERLTNKNCARFFTLLVAITAATGSVIYFLLMTRCAYTVFTYIIYLSTHDGNSYASADSKKLVFDQFSIQYQTIILVVPIFFLFSLPDLTVIIRFARYGVSALILYVCFIIYLFIDNCVSGGLSANKGQIPLFTHNFANVSGNLALGFFTQNFIVSITAKHEKFEKNTLALRYGFILSFVIYLTLGIFGALGVVGRQKVEDPRTISDYFNPNDIFSTVVQFVYFLHLVTVIPIWNHIARTQFFIFLGDCDPSTIKKLSFNLFTASICFLIQFFNLDVNTVVNLDSTIICSSFVYIVPFIIRYKEIKFAINQQQSNFSEDDTVLLKQASFKGQFAPEGPTVKNQQNERIKSFLDQDAQQQLTRAQPITVAEYCAWAFVFAFGLVNVYLQIVDIFF